MRPSTLVPALLAVLAGAPASADPRWWWNDLRLTDTPADSITPHLTTPGYASGGAGGSGVFVTWSEVDPVQGDLDVWMTASFDGGCTFCPATRITDTDVDEITPRIAVLALPEGFWSFAVTYAQPANGQVHVAWSSTHVTFRVPLEQLCPQIEALGPAIVAADQYVRFGGVDAEGETPDISSASTFSFGHFHLAWKEHTLGGPIIRYAHDLTARGMPGWQMDPVKTLAMLGPIDVELERPRVAADTTTDPDPVSGTNTNDRTGVNVVWVRRREAGPSVIGSIEGVRSIDSGATFSPLGDRVDAPGTAVSDSFVATMDVDVRTALDAGFSQFSTTEPSWVGAAWSADVIGDVPLLRADERFVAEPSRPSPDWQVPGDDDLGGCAVNGDGAPTVAIQRQFGDQPSPEWLAWHDSRFGSAREIASHAGMLDRTASPVLDLTRHPIAPVRPLDSAVSTITQLTHCVVDEATFACLPSRARGDAVDAALDANEQGVFAVWSDSRDGNREIYFKRTDTYVQQVSCTLATGCDPSGGAWVDVTFDLVRNCPTEVANERMLRYLIYWRRDTAGPWENAAAPLVVLHDTEAGPSVTRRFGGLLTGTTYRFLVVPEDQARNVYPPDFNPGVAPPAPPFSEQPIDTPTPCAVAEPCLWRSDVTGLSPHVPARSAVYLVPPTADDIHVQGSAYDCPVAPGDLEPDAQALDNGVPLSLYQVNRPVGTLRLSKSARTIRFDF